MGLASMGKDVVNSGRASEARDSAFDVFRKTPDILWFWLDEVRWLSGRKQSFAKAPSSKRAPRVRIPPSPPIELHVRFPTFRLETPHDMGGMRTRQEGLTTMRDSANPIAKP
jgi:hypothetical protein